MKILLITPYYPFPAEKSGGVHTVNMILNNLSTHCIDIFYYGENRLSLGEEKSLKFINNVYYQDLRVGGLICRLKSIVSKKTYSLAMYKKKSSVLEKILNSTKYDKIIYDQYASMNKYIGDSKKSILLMHDSMPLLFDRKKDLTGLLGKVYYTLQKIYAVDEENKYYDGFQKVFFVSSLDCDYEKYLHPNFDKKFEVINLGVDMKAVETAPKLSIGSNSLVFTGVMDYEPNEDAMIFFLKYVFPKVIKTIPNLKLYIVGKNPTERLKELASGIENVIITGKVDSVFSYIKSATIYISPLRMGSGKKNKIIEAMACQIPIIASDISMDGFEEFELEVVTKANSAQEWIDEIVKMISDESKMILIRKKMENVISSKYDWSIISSHIIS